MLIRFLFKLVIGGLFVGGSQVESLLLSLVMYALGLVLVDVYADNKDRLE